MKVVKVFSKDARVTKESIVKLLGVDQQTFDYALPQDWVEDIGHNAVPHFVWLYEKGSIFGCPRPLTSEGIDMLMRYNMKKGTHYSTDYDVVRFE